MNYNRRVFIKSTGVLAGAGFISQVGSGGESKKYKAAIIGHTGGGDYGHSYDTIFSNLAQVSVEAVADVSEEGAKQAAQRSGAPRIYTDYQKMLEKENVYSVVVILDIPLTNSCVKINRNKAHIMYAKGE